MNTKQVKLLLLLSVLVLFLFFLHLNNGKFSFDFKLILKSLFRFNPENQTEIIFREIRFPRSIMAIVAGAGLSISGLLIQTFFKNPLAGPSVLGITSGASLFVAISVLTGIQFFTSDYGIVFSALFGAFLFSIIILLFSFFVKSAVSLLLVGLMLSSFTSAVIQILQMVSSTNQLKVFTLWGFGSLQQVQFNQIGFILILFLIACLVLVILIKPLNLLVLGEREAEFLGLKMKSFKFLIIGVSSLYAGLITAFCGPISFIGLAVPNISKLIFKTQNQLVLILGSMLIGAFCLLFCDLLLIYLESIILLPLNGITSLIGAPFVVWIILKKY